MLSQPAPGSLRIRGVASHEAQKARECPETRRCASSWSDDIVEDRGRREDEAPVQGDRPVRDALPHRARWPRTVTAAGTTPTAGTSSATRAMSTRRASRRATPRAAPRSTDRPSRLDRRTSWRGARGARAPCAARAASDHTAARRARTAGSTRTSWGTPAIVRVRPAPREGRLASCAFRARARLMCLRSHVPCSSSSLPAKAAGARIGSTTTASPDGVTVNRARRARVERRTVYSRGVVRGSGTRIGIGHQPGVGRSERAGGLPRRGPGPPLERLARFVQRDRHQAEAVTGTQLSDDRPVDAGDDRHHGIAPDRRPVREKDDGPASRRKLDGTPCHATRDQLGYQRRTWRPAGNPRGGCPCGHSDGRHPRSPRPGARRCRGRRHPRVGRAPRAPSGAGRQGRRRRRLPGRAIDVRLLPLPRAIGPTAGRLPQGAVHRGHRNRRPEPSRPTQGSSGTSIPPGSARYPRAPSTAAEKSRMSPRSRRR